MLIKGHWVIVERHRRYRQLHTSACFHLIRDISVYARVNKQQVRKARRHRSRNVNQFTAQAEARETSLFHTIPIMSNIMSCQKQLLNEFQVAL